MEVGSTALSTKQLPRVFKAQFRSCQQPLQTVPVPRLNKAAGTSVPSAPAPVLFLSVGIRQQLQAAPLRRWDGATAAMGLSF